MSDFEKDHITEEEYLIGEANGISRRNVYQRWYFYGWSIERATTEPIKRNPSKWAEWKEIALQNGIYNELFHSRLRKGLTEEQAATIPVGPVFGKINA